VIIAAVPNRTVGRARRRGEFLADADFVPAEMSALRRSGVLGGIAVMS